MINLFLVKRSTIVITRVDLYTSSILYSGIFLGFRVFGTFDDLEFWRSDLFVFRVIFPSVSINIIIFFSILINFDRSKIIKNL